VKTLREDGGKPSDLLEFNHVDGRDKPGHDGVDRFDYFAASINRNLLAFFRTRALDDAPHGYALRQPRSRPRFASFAKVDFPAGPSFK